METKTMSAKPAADHPAYLTLDEIAERLRISHTSALKLVRTGQLLALDVATAPGRRHFVVSWESLMAFEQSRIVLAVKPPVQTRVKNRKRRKTYIT